MRLSPLTSEKEWVISKLALSQRVSKRLIERAKIIQLSNGGLTITQIVQQLHLSEPLVRMWWKQFSERLDLEFVQKKGIL